ncbi:hypothetical protein H5410_022106 [Solanum commersonii]|uniref:Zinc finger PMZ-type domain-containing protein n=1 Tax=Solanum commersonii TaxID=4109 RepID=A0A9J5ZD88_SOLCO|nr:hypothetical protein H5410_022106 [Solanum commersonii]
MTLVLIGCKTLKKRVEIREEILVHMPCSCIMISISLHNIVKFNLIETNGMRKKFICRTWDLTSIPCPHAIIAYLHDRQEPPD